MNATDLIRQDHQAARELYERFEAAMSEERTDIGTELLKELTVHAIIEEEIFYPALENAGEKPIIDEYRAEHAAMKSEIARLSRFDAADEEYGPSMKALMDTVNHHIEEEESGGLPAAETVLSEGELEVLGQQMEARKGELEDSTIKRLWAAAMS